MVPTYPKLEPSFMTGLQKVTMTMFNKRAEVEFYEIGVFTSDWNPIPFVSQFKVYKIPYLSTVTFDIFIRDEDKSNVTYICSQSKLRKTIETRTAVSSRICSKVKRNVLK
tara:strand:- start:79 stop:408 length:330 start_codon:yes stop_codon:yes gene_type:complete